MRHLLMGALLCAGGCSDVPRDPDETRERVIRARSFRVGVVARPSAITVPELAFLKAVEQETLSRAQIEMGPAESLLPKLENGGLDLVVGHFDVATPWKTRVTFVPPLSGRSGDEAQLRASAAAKNGENGWITLLHRHSEALGGQQ